MAIRAMGNDHLPSWFPSIATMLCCLPIRKNPRQAKFVRRRELPAVREKLREAGHGGRVGIDGRFSGAAAAALTRQNPAEAPVIMASAMELLNENPKKIS